MTSRSRLIILSLAIAGVAVAAGAIQLVAGQTAYFADLAYAPLFFTIGRHADRRVRLAGLVVAALASVTGALNVVFNPDRAASASNAAGPSRSG